MIAISRTAYEKNYARIAFGNITTVFEQEIDQLDNKDKMAFILDVGCPGYQNVLDKVRTNYVFVIVGVDFALFLCKITRQN